MTDLPVRWGMGILKNGMIFKLEGRGGYTFTVYARVTIALKIDSYGEESNKPPSLYVLK